MSPTSDAYQAGRAQGFRDAVRAMTRITTDAHTRDMMQVWKAMAAVMTEQLTDEELDEDARSSVYWSSGA
jgi:hypothetical protein